MKAISFGPYFVSKLKLNLFLHPSTGRNVSPSKAGRGVIFAQFFPRFSLYFRRYALIVDYRVFGRMILLPLPWRVGF
ncbi:hypothetical protein D1O30_13460 [Methylocystis hirsuta]|uniref:Uncharacterized protein n=1 Tax=Methylocystis hirsuta TaxID=369798 RepID=A0A3M9XQ76_9HYPH|nr:hypothetical protein D1O30_13460 [Methylocystis hirsuta]